MVAASPDFDTWKQELLQELETQPNVVAKGDRFVQRVLRYWRQLSEDDAINATEAAGGGDHGVDALLVDPAEDDEPPRALVVQGKYGTAGEQASPLAEFHKFAKALAAARANKPPTSALEQCASVLRTDGGLVQYVIATIELLSDTQLSELDSARAIANQNFGS